MIEIADSSRADRWTRPILGLICILLLVGCDYGRSARYRILAVPRSHSWAKNTFSGDGADRISTLLANNMERRGFSKAETERWEMNGVTVRWERIDPNEVRLIVWAFGAKRFLRESERIESELLRDLRANSELRITPENDSITINAE